MLEMDIKHKTVGSNASPLISNVDDVDEVLEYNTLGMQLS